METTKGDPGCFVLPLLCAIILFFLGGALCGSSYDPCRIEAARCEGYCAHEGKNGSTAGGQPLSCNHCTCVDLKPDWKPYPPATDMRQK